MPEGNDRREPHSALDRLRAATHGPNTHAGENLFHILLAIYLKGATSSHTMPVSLYGLASDQKKIENRVFLPLHFAG